MCGFYAIKKQCELSSGRGGQRLWTGIEDASMFIAIETIAITETNLSVSGSRRRTAMACLPRAARGLGLRCLPGENLLPNSARIRTPPEAKTGPRDTTGPKFIIAARC